MKARKMAAGLVLAGLVLAGLALLAACPSLALTLHEREIPVPSTVSDRMRENVARPYPADWLVKPMSLEEYTRVLNEANRGSDEKILALAKSADVTMEERTMAGVRVFMATPRNILPQNRDRLLIHVHGGGYVFFPGLIGAGEAIYMAHYGGIRCLSVDYRLAPQYPYPAALDDCMAVYREVLKSTPPEKVGLFGTSAGGSLVLSMVLRAKMEKLPMPGAICPATPWADLDKIGDSYFANEGVDNALVRYEGWVGDAVKVYAPGMDLKDPLLSPVYGDFAGFPPTLLVAGTRDLFLSNTVRVHARMLEANVDARLVVHEALSHAQYLESFSAPETVFHFRELGKFFEQNLR